jgi:TnpA family transposase
MSYPAFRRFSEDELRDHFFLGPEEVALARSLRHEQNQLGMAVFLKTYQFLGYTPHYSEDIPQQVVDHISAQFGLPGNVFREYEWRSRLWMDHLGLLRKHFQTRAFEGTDRDLVGDWLDGQGEELLTRSEWAEAAVDYLRNQGIELPQKAELVRLAQSARKRFEDRLFSNVISKLDDKTRLWLDGLLEIEDGTSRFDWLKTPPGKPGKKTFLSEAKKLQLLREFPLDRVDLKGFSERRIKNLRNRVRAEDASLMRQHPPNRRYPLLAAWICSQKMEITDDLVNLFLHIIRRVERKSREALQSEVDLNKVYGTRRILHQLARACRDRPDAPISTVMLEEMGEETLQALYAELDHGQATLENARAKKVQQKFRGYQKMVSSMLEVLDFRTGNDKRKPLLEGLALIAKHSDSQKTYISEKLPEDLPTGAWEGALVEEGPKGPRIRRRALEVCVLSQLEEALKCKEVWVQGAYQFRDPDKDLPQDWDEKRPHYYKRLNLPLSSKTFVETLKSELEQSLRKANEYQSGRDKDAGGPEVRRTPGGKAYLYVPTPSKRPERSILGEIKDRVDLHFGVLDLLDVLAEVDRRVDLTAHFHTSGQRRILGIEEVRKRLLLVLFGLGTNLGLQRLHSAAKPDCSYDDLRYFMRRFVTPEALREANIALVNHILELRNPKLWGNGTSCASDGKFLAAWDRNLTTEWNPHYKGRGVKVYWHVDHGAVAIHSQVKSPSCTEVAPMIEGVVHHGTLAAIETNCVDTGGQSLPAFGLCRPLQFDLLPRFRQVKRFQLNLPFSGLASELPALNGVTTRAIRWDLIEERYDDYARHAAAILEKTGPIESILRRFTRYNRPHPTYRALLELGRVERTIYLCRLLSEPDLHVWVHDQLNGIESWNSCNQFICFARRSELRTNDPVVQELTIGSLHLLQNAMVLANVLMVEEVLDRDLFERMNTEDLRALTPLFTSSINPYGEFELDLDKPSFLEAS